MEHRDFEKQLKNKLEKRSLTPSSDAWNKLETLLETPEEEKGSVKHWYWVAATVAVVLLGVLFMDREDSVSSNQWVTDEKNDLPINEQTISPEMNKQFQEANGAYDEVVEQQAPVENNDPDSNYKTTTGLDKEKRYADIAREEFKVAHKETEVTQINQEQSAAVVSFEDKKVEEVVGKIQLLESAGTRVTDAEIEALLLAAQKEIDSHKNFIENHTRVDATALLLDVEEELDRSFKDKVFEALQRGFQKAKSAVAERNN